MAKSSYRILRPGGSLTIANIFSKVDPSKLETEDNGLIKKICDGRVGYMHHISDIIGSSEAAGFEVETKEVTQNIIPSVQYLEDLCKVGLTNPRMNEIKHANRQAIIAISQLFQKGAVGYFFVKAVKSKAD